MTHGCRQRIRSEGAPSDCVGLGVGPAGHAAGTERALGLAIAVLSRNGMGKAGCDFRESEGRRRERADSRADPESVRLERQRRRLRYQANK